MGAAHKRALSSGAIAGFASRQPYGITVCTYTLPAYLLHDTSEQSRIYSARTLATKSISITTERARLPVVSTVASCVLPSTAPSHCMSLLPQHHAVPWASHELPATSIMLTAPVGLWDSGAALLRAVVKADIAHVSSHFPISCAALATSATAHRDAIQSVAP